MTNIHKILSVAMLTIALGCGDGTTPIPNLVPCQGTVTLDGEPLPHGMVGFDPLDVTSGWSATGEIKDGKFNLVTTVSAPGVVVGKYQVRVVSEGEGQISPDGQIQRPKSLVPQKYNDSTRSGLEVEVTKGMKPVELKLLSK